MRGAFPIDADAMRTLVIRAEDLKEINWTNVSTDTLVSEGNVKSVYNTDRRYDHLPIEARSFQRGFGSTLLGLFAQLSLEDNKVPDRSAEYLRPMQRGDSALQESGASLHHSSYRRP
jgi:hypothetical protein